MMMAEGNVLLLDEPTNHLDLESITAFNNSLMNFPGTVMFTSHDHHFIQSIADRIIEIGPNGVVDKPSDYDSYREDKELKVRRDELYTGFSIDA